MINDLILQFMLQYCPDIVNQAIHQYPDEPYSDDPRVRVKVQKKPTKVVHTYEANGVQYDILDY